MIDRGRLKTDVLALAGLAASIFVGLALVTFDPHDPPSDALYPPRDLPLNACGPWGAWLAYRTREALGWGAWFLWSALAWWTGCLFTRRKLSDFSLRGLGAVAALLAVCCGVRLGNLLPGGGTVVGSGGYVGAWSAILIEQHFSPLGCWLLLGGVFLSGMLLATDLLFFRIVAGMLFGPVLLVFRLFAQKKAGAPASVVPPAVADEHAAAEEDTAESVTASAPSMSGSCSAQQPEAVRDCDIDGNADGNADPADGDLLPLRGEFGDGSALDDDGDDSSHPRLATLPLSQPARSIRVNPPMSAVTRSLPAAPPAEPVDFELPDLDLLEPAEEFPYEFLAEKARLAAATLEKTFQEFGLNVRVVEIDTGPVITQFELELEAGLRLNKVTALADDLAIALRVPSVRVVAPIPGKNTVGVEVPNDKQVMVRLRELIEACPDALEKKRIPMFLGKDVTGRPLVVDLAKMPHLLIAGRTGTGKSVCLNSLILSILMTRTPDQVRLLMIDPKMVELSPYMRVPHLMHPVITDMKKAEAVLAWAVEKMEERYDLLARCGVRHLDSYNDLSRSEKLRRLGLEPEAEGADQVPDSMPFIVIIADEMADMMMTSGKDVESHIIRLAQKSRAVGIHLVLATQKPTVDVITGLIKSNLPARISFQVASRTDSRVVLDEMGADKLLGNGDMLYLAPGTSKMTRAQGTYVSDAEVNGIIEFFGDCPPQYSRELAQLQSRGTGAKQGIEAIRARDELYEQAIDVVVREGRGSVSLLQRCLGIGYGRAARLVDYMAEDGIVGDYNGSQAREVLYTPDQWQAFVHGESAATEEALA